MVCLRNANHNITCHWRTDSARSGLLYFGFSQISAPTGKEYTGSRWAYPAWRIHVAREDAWTFKFLANKLVGQYPNISFVLPGAYRINNWNKLYVLQKSIYVSTSQLIAFFLYQLREPHLSKEDTNEFMCWLWDVCEFYFESDRHPFMSPEHFVNGYVWIFS